MSPKRPSWMRRALGWYFYRHAPFMSRGHYPLEMRAWALLSLALGGVEGGVAGVLVKNVYAGTVDETLLNFCVALASGAPAFANVSSFGWAALAQGRDKIRMLFRLQLGLVAALLAIAVAPFDALGLLLLIAGVVSARLMWAGIITVRAAVWLANYPRNARAALTGRLTVLSSLMLGGAGILIGWVLDAEQAAVRWVYPAIAVAGLAGSLVFRRVRIRRHRQLLRAERLEGDSTGRVRLDGIWRILRQDAPFRRYMLTMFVFGSGNLMLIAPLILALNEHLRMSQLEQVLITSSLPLMVLPFTIPLWASLLDRTHIVPYRAVHSWIFVISSGTLTVGAIFGWIPLLWLGSLLLGASYAGGNLGWNLGHNDFAPPEKAAQYMGVHATLTGVRGLIAPVAGTSLYQALDTWVPGAGPWALLLPFALTTTGAFGFVLMRQRMRMERAGTWLGRHTATDRPALHQSPP